MKKMKSGKCVAFFSSTAKVAAAAGAAKTTHFDVKEELRKRLAEELERQKAKRAGQDTPPPAPAAAVVTPLVLADGQVSASTLLGFDVKPDFAVTVLKNDDIPVQVRAFIPVVNPAYVVQQKEAVEVLRAMQNGDKILVTGPTGSGKSSLIQHLCALTNRPMIRLNMSGDVESANIFGQLTAKDGATVWTDGAATEAVRYGAVLVNDEWDVTPPEIMFGYQWLMEDNGKLYLKEMPGTSEDKMILPHKEFRFVCLGNTLGQGDDTGKHAGTNVQNTATIDRFQTTVTLGYLDTVHEVSMLNSALKGLDIKQVRNMVSVARLIRDGYMCGQLSLTMSPRTLLNWGNKMLQWEDDVGRTFALSYANKLTEQERGVAKALLAKVFGSSVK